MELNKIRSMTDEELKAYLKSIGDRKTSNCIKCGKTNAEYTINVKSVSRFQQKKLCSLCEECYENMILKMELTDILWD